MKKTGRSIREKSARIPEIRETRWNQDVPAYLESVKSQVSESAKSQRFLLLLNELFGVQPGFIEDYFSGIEKYVRVKQKDRLLKGRIDELFGNLVIEFERDMPKKQEEAEEQLRKYIACLWSQESPRKRTPYLCMATDGLAFTIYSPTIEDATKIDIQPDEVQLELVERMNLTSLKPQEVYFWLDRYFCRKEILHPKTENIVKDFGVQSHAFKTASRALHSLWKRCKDKSEFGVVYESWEKYLRIVYGSSVADEELFCRHTYLATLAKLMAWIRLSEGASLLYDAQIHSVLEGEFFKNQGIENFLEEDFFSWIIREDARVYGIEIARRLISLLGNYYLRELSEDVMKSLYQELVDPQTRHDLGEFYTPDWLAHRMVHKLIEQNQEASFLDPACGSGTFLYFAIKEKRERLPHTQKTLEHILNSVSGVDIHPLAVITAKTNYLFALGDLLKKRKGKVSIPVYLSDTIRLPEKETKPMIIFWTEVPCYKVKIEGKEIYLPEKLLQSPALYDEAIEATREFSLQNAGRRVSESQFISFIQIQYPALPRETEIFKALFHIAETLKSFIETRRDTIQAFVLKNIYKPLFLKGRFDFVIGNPPWLSFRYAEPDYQKFLKDQIIRRYNLLSGRGELITHLELATLFLLRTADLYLKEGGTIAFILPRSIFTADQHIGLREGKFTNIELSFKEIWDLEKVEPLFNYPAGVLFAQKQPVSELSYPISGQRLSGKLPRRNASVSEAEQSLSTNEVSFFIHKRGKLSFWATQRQIGEEKESFYKKHFFQGSTIFPRSFWFVKIITSPHFGFNPVLPPLESSERAKKQAKEAYKGLVLRGNVERRFLYATLLSADLLPFGHLGFRLVVLPIEVLQTKTGEFRYRLIKSNEARLRGFVHLANWLEKAQKEWEKRRGAKAKGMDIYERLDRYHSLSRQDPQAIYRVFYNTHGTYLCACISESKQIEFIINGQKVQPSGLVAESKTYYFATTDEEEANYLVAILNAPIIDSMIKPMQARGLWGPRSIHKKLFEIPIPQFNPSDKNHLLLAELGKLCTQKVSRWLDSGGPGKIKSIGVLRSRVREMLKQELTEIDRLVQQILAA